MVLQQRTLHLGKEFGAFDLAVYQSYQPIKPPKFFDIVDCLSQCLWEQETSGNVNEPDKTIDDPNSDPGDAPPSFWINPTPGPSIPSVFSSSSPSIPSTSSSPIPPSLSSSSGAGGKWHPGLKQVIIKWQREATGNAIQVDVNINWGGMLLIPIINSHGGIIVILGGMPRDIKNGKTVTNGAAKLMEDNAHRLSVSEEQLNHCCAHGSYPSIARGVSHGGGQTEPGNLQTNKKNKQITDELLTHEHFGFPILFWMFAPLLAMFFQVQMGLLTASKPFPLILLILLGGGGAPSRPSVASTPDRGGHLILWDLKLIIRFPLGSTVLTPSTLICHSNVPIAVDKFRVSFTQYTASGLFRWIQNGFKTDEQFELTTSLVNSKTTQGNRRVTLDKYYQKNAPALHKKARLQMQKRCAELKKSEELMKLVKGHRRKADAEYREVIRHQKYIKKHGTEKYFKYYILLLQQFNGDLAAVKVPTREEDDTSGFDVDEDSVCKA
ncbi:hypothetical protein MVEN_01729200 [Mycena venus]|uniref:Uncharacterized protein n=1 Tax=Mycena venus TaxID=2733690 RepID=A0A8H6XM29_9AGAR|nr:hypothetical protein MVEN_01729200 [Mycena venus]